METGQYGMGWIELDEIYLESCRWMLESVPVRIAVGFSQKSIFLRFFTEFCPFFPGSDIFWKKGGSGLD